MSSVYDVSNYQFSKAEKLLIDTNIWLYVHPPFPVSADKRQRKVYSRALKRMLSEESTLLTNVVILSEYLNVFSRKIFHARYRREFVNFKQFRDSPWFRKVGRDAVGYVRSILRICNWSEEATGVTDQILNDFAIGRLDFNDALIRSLCQACDWKLVTDDHDFRDCGIGVITANRRLLR